MTSQKKGSKQVQVPIALGERQRVRRAITWILEASDKRNGTSEGNSKKFGVRVAYEIEAILQGRSSVLEKKDKLHKDAIVGRSNIAMGRR